MEGVVQWTLTPPYVVISLIKTDGFSSQATDHAQIPPIHVPANFETRKERQLESTYRWILAGDTQCAPGQSAHRCRTVCRHTACRRAGYRQTRRLLVRRDTRRHRSTPGDCRSAYLYTEHRRHNAILTTVPSRQLYTTYSSITTLCTEDKKVN